MENKVQLKTGDKIKIPTRKTSGMSINGFLEEYPICGVLNLSDITTIWNELNNIHQQQENNKNALTILALRS